MKTVFVHKSMIKVGNAIVFHGKVRTVCKRYLKRNGFMGITIFGDNYNLGTRPVEKVVL